MQGSLRYVMSVVMDEVFDNWTVQLRKGVVELCVLSAIGARDECYGYELVQELVNARGLDVSEGSVYPLLSRLRKQGVVSTKLVESAEGPARKYYQLTALGRARVKAMQAYYDELNEGVLKIRQPKKSN